MKRLLIFLLLLSLLPWSTALSQITVNSAIVNFGATKSPVLNLIVSNPSENTMYVVASVVSVPNPGEDPGKTVETDELLVSPRKFSVEATGRRTIRLLLRSKAKEQEKVYRVSFVPQDRGFGETIETHLGKQRALIRVLTGMGVLVFADPLNPRADFSWTRNGNSLHFENSGNVNVFFGDGKACENGNPEDCTPLPAKRVYPGYDFDVEVARNKVVTYGAQLGADIGYQRITIPAGDGSSKRESSVPEPSPDQEDLPNA